VPLRLVATTGTQTVTLPAGRPLVVGRTPGCDLPVRDSTVSRRHAELAPSDGGLEVRDLGSTNGTFVNGERIEQGMARPGDQVTFGRAVFELRDEPEDGRGESVSEAQALDATVVRRRVVTAPGLAPWADQAPGAALRGLASPFERQARRLELLLDAAKALSGQIDIDRLLARLVELAVGAMDVDRAALLLVEEDGGLASRAVHGRDGGSDTWQVPEAIAQEAVEQRVALLVENAGADPRFDGTDRGTTERAAVQSALCAPLLGRDGGVLGLIYLDSLSAPRSFDDEDLDFLVSFAGMAAVALENSRLIARVRREAAVLANFQRYFAPELAEEIAAERGTIRLGGDKRQVVVLFSDIRGFTALSEELPPDEIAALLNEYFTEMVEIVFEHGGTLDKFMGDAMMALWGAPVARADDADRAARAAVAMQREIARLNRRWSAAGRRTLAVGIGLNAGEAFAGNIGSDRRLEYTVLGDAVNTAALLCARAGAGEILAGEPVCRLLADPPPLTPLDPLPLKGKAQTVPVYRVDWDG
jgi:adenylate cyclase